MDNLQVLLVEDDPLYQELLTGALEDNGYEIVVAETGEAAWKIIDKLRQGLGAILLDRLLPDMDSLTLVARLKADRELTHLPVIMQTSMTAPEEVAAGLRAGVQYYLTKPYRPEALLAILRAAVRDRREFMRLQASVRETDDFMRHLDYVDAWFRTPDEAGRLASFAARVCPDPARTVLGLSELMLNAIEHGNLAIGYEEKTRLIVADRLMEEVSQRLWQPEYGHRRARLTIERLPGTYEFTIKDEGNGFRWEPYLDLSPERAYDAHGRGIAMARRFSFDSLEYRGCGNTVVARVQA